MKSACIEITLLSDMSTSDGSVYNSALDTEVVHDSFGFPYIPAKRLRGCLRECALELSDWGVDISPDDLFGKEGDASNHGKIRFSDALIKNHEKNCEEIRKAFSSSIVHPQNILEMYTSIRTQTAIDPETGTAEETSMRTLRVVNKGLVFESEILFDDPDGSVEKELQTVLTVFHHMGLGRTRGLGEVKAELKNIREKETIGNPVSIPDGAETLYYQLDTLEPIVCKSIAGGQAKTQDYIEGSKIMGLIASREKTNDAFLKLMNQSELIFSDAFITDGKNRYTEVPASDYSIKNNKDEFLDKLYPADSEHGKLQVSHMKHTYVYDDGTVFLKKDVKTEQRYHHTRPEDKSIGRAAPDADPKSQFYQISSICAGQSFMGWIHGTSEQICEVAGLINQDEDCFIGFARSSEYGHCRIHLLPFKNREVLKFTSSHVALKLISSAIIYNDRAMASSHPEDLVAAAENVLHINRNNIRNISMYLNYGETGGYNITWNQQKPAVPVFDKGTVISFELNEPQEFEISMPLVIGERVQEGFGEIMLLDLKPSGQFAREYTKEEKQKNSVDLNIKGIPFLQSAALHVFEKEIRADASQLAVDKFKKCDETMKATVSDMALMCDSYQTVEEVAASCRARYDKKTGNKQKKLKNAEKILSYVTGEKDAVDDSLENFEKTYHLQGLEFDGRKIRFDYLKELLKQIKYTIRQEEKGESHE